MHKALHPRDNIDYTCQEKKKKNEDWPALRIVFLSQYKDSRIALKRADRLIVTTNNNISKYRLKKQEKLESKN